MFQYDDDGRIIVIESEIRKDLKAETKYAIKYAIPFCVYCGKRDKDQLAVEHIWPRAKKGGNRLQNLTVSCNRCNSFKSTDGPEDFMYRMHRKRMELYHQTLSFIQQIRTGRFLHNTYSAPYLKGRIKKNRKEFSYFSSIIGNILRENHRVHAASSYIVREEYCQKKHRFSVTTPKNCLYGNI